MNNKQIPVSLFRFKKFIWFFGVYYAFRRKSGGFFYALKNTLKINTEILDRYFYLPHLCGVIKTNDMKEQIKVSAKYKITTETDAQGRPCAALILMTPKGKYSKEKTIRSHYFGNEDARYKWAIKTAGQIMEQERAAAARKEANKTAAKNSGVVVGSIFSHSWGYDQTNIDFYEVVKMSGQTATIRELCQNKEDTGWSQGKCTPIPGDFYGKKEIVKRVQVSGKSVYLSMECGWCQLWDGKPENWTAYA